MINAMIGNNSKRPLEPPVLRYKIGRELKNIRKQRGYTQEQLASMMGISRSTVSKIENGKFSISIDYMELIAIFLNIEIDIKPRIQ